MKNKTTMKLINPKIIKPFNGRKRLQRTRTCQVNLSLSFSSLISGLLNRSFSSSTTLPNNLFNFIRASVKNKTTMKLINPKIIKPFNGRKRLQRTRTCQVNLSLSFSSLISGLLNRSFSSSTTLPNNLFYIKRHNIF